MLAIDADAIVLVFLGVGRGVGEKAVKFWGLQETAFMRGTQVKLIGLKAFFFVEKSGFLDCSSAFSNARVSLQEVTFITLYALFAFSILFAVLDSTHPHSR